MIVVSGITGQTGSATARHLLAAGAPVTGLSRNPAAELEGARVAAVDLSDTGALTEVLRDARAFYVLLPPQWGAPNLFDAVQPIIDSVTAAIEAADVPRVVVLSSIAAHQPSGTGPIRSLRPLEAALAGRDGVTFLRPAYFAANLASLREAVQGGQLPTFWDPTRSLSVIDTDDIGAVAAEQLLAENGPRILQLAGPVDVSWTQVAHALSAVVGHPVAPLALPPEAITPQLEQLGAGHLATLYAEMNRGVGDGTVEFDPEFTVRRISTPLAESLRRALG